MEPLPRGFPVPQPSSLLIHVCFRYEKLADFCYRCGRIGHVRSICDWSDDMCLAKLYDHSLCIEALSPYRK